MTIPSNEFLIQSLVDSLQSALAAMTERDAARDKYQGYEWGYAGYDLNKKADETAAVFGERLEELIDARVQAAIEAHSIK